MMYLTRKYEFCASHRLYNPTFSETQNWEVFRECSHVNGHGHNYELEVTVSGTPDPVTGMLVDIYELDQVVQRVLLQKMDHRHLNFDVDFLKDLIPTAENIVWACWGQLESCIPGEAKLHRLRLMETRNNFAEYAGEPR